MTDILLDGRSLAPADVAAVARDDARVGVPESAWADVRDARERVEEVVRSREATYGLNTGFGDLVDERIPPDDIEQLQLNLVRSHAAGVGRELTREEVRAMLCVRINTLVKGYSGIRPVVLEYLVSMLNEGVHPVVKSRGSLGASGDLAPLAHVALVLLGEGEADCETGGASERLQGAAALASIDREPLALAAKEGLALINGTQLVAGIGALVVVDAERALRAADIAGGLTTEVTMATTANCDPAIQAVRPFAGQADSARNVRAVTADSAIIESHRNCDRVQDAYAIRCLPQVHGAVRDAIAHLREGVEVELNSATDNPLVFPGADVDPRASGTDEAAVLSGGNFHAAPLAHRLDYATRALADLASISERRIDRLLHPKLQESHLPPFLTAESGLESGLMLAQYTAASLVNETRSLGSPAADNIPVSGNQEDHVSMAAQSAFHAQTAVAHAATVVGIELVCGAQAAEFVPDDLALGVGTDAAYRAIRGQVARLETDRPLHGDIDAATELVTGGSLLARVEGALDRELA